MNYKREDDSADGNQVVPTNDGSSSSAIVEVRKIHRRGGYFVGVSGWSGITYWALRKITGFISYGSIWAVFLTFGWTIADETTRIWVRGILGAEQKTIMPNDGNRFPLLETDGYHNLSLFWKQLLAEVQVNQSKYPLRFVSLLRELTLNDISTLDHIAPYVVDNAIIHAADLDLGYDIPFVTDLEFERLKTIGIFTSPRFGGMVRSVAPKNGNPAQEIFKGTTLALIARASDSSKTFQLHLTPLTEEGAKIISLLRRPTSLKALCMVAARIKQNKEIETHIFATLAPEAGGGGWSDRSAVVNVSQRCTQFGTGLVNQAGGE